LGLSGIEQGEIKKPQLRYCGQPRPFPEGNDSANVMFNIETSHNCGNKNVNGKLKGATKYSVRGRSKDLRGDILIDKVIAELPDKYE